MGSFRKAIVFTRLREGGYVNDRDDSGGETYCGISRNANPDWEGWAIVDAHKPMAYNYQVPLTTAEGLRLNDLVNEYYHTRYWMPLLLDDVKSDSVSGELFDWHVMSGKPAVMAVQRLTSVSVDGQMGPHTVEAINNYSGGAELLFKRLVVTRENIYRQLAASEPKDGKYLKGWLERCESLTFNG